MQNDECAGHVMPACYRKELHDDEAEMPPQQKCEADKAPQQHCEAGDETALETDARLCEGKAERKCARTALQRCARCNVKT